MTEGPLSIRSTDKPIRLTRCPLPARQRTFFRPGSKGGGEQTLPSAKRWKNRSRVGPGSIGFSASGIWRSSRGHTEHGKERKGFNCLSIQGRSKVLRPIKQAGKQASTLDLGHYSTRHTWAGEEGAGILKLKVKDPGLPAFAALAAQLVTSAGWADVIRLCLSRFPSDDVAPMCVIVSSRRGLVTC